MTVHTPGGFIMLPHGVTILLGSWCGISWIHIILTMWWLLFINKKKIVCLWFDSANGLNPWPLTGRSRHYTMYVMELLLRYMRWVLDTRTTWLTLNTGSCWFSLNTGFGYGMTWRGSAGNKAYCEENNITWVQPYKEKTKIVVWWMGVNSWSVANSSSGEKTVVSQGQCVKDCWPIWWMDLSIRSKSPRRSRLGEGGECVAPTKSNVNIVANF